MTKLHSEFYRSAINLCGTRGLCKKCKKIYDVKWNTQNRELQKLYTRRSRARDPERAKALSRKIYLGMKARGTLPKQKKLSQKTEM